MEIVTLFSACVVSIGFARVGAMDNDQGPSRPSSEIYIHERLGRLHHVSDYPQIHPDIDSWANHRHNHPTRMLDPLTHHPNPSRKEIRIEKLIDCCVTNWFLLQGELVHDANIANCNSPYGYATVDLKGSERYYACLRPFLYHNETRSREHTTGPQVYVASLVRPGMPRIDAELASRDERPGLEAIGMLFHGSTPDHYLMESLGRVQYVIPNSTTVYGDLYQYS